MCASKTVMLGRQPRAFWLDERGTNIWLYGQSGLSLPYTDMDFCRGPSAAFGPWGPPKEVKKWARLDERGTIWNQFEMIGYNTQFTKWHMPEKFSAAKGPPEALKGPLKFDLG